MRRQVTSIFLILLLLLSITHAVSYALKLTITADDICKSIQNEPSKWVISDMKAVLFENEEYASHERGETWPEHGTGVAAVLNYSIYNDYVSLETPMKIDYDGKDKIKILKVLKIYKYNEYKKDLGIKDKVIVKEVQKQPTMSKDGLLQLK